MNGIKSQLLYPLEFERKKILNVGLEVALEVSDG